MGKITVPIMLATGVMALPLLFSGCGMLKGVHDTVPEELQGHWVDVNGSTTLDIDASRMTVTSPWDKETYKVKITGEDTRYIENARPENSYDNGFSYISTIMIGSDGVLTAREMVTDAEGHEYRFVREEDLEKELEIRIRDRDLPKTIESDEIVYFNLNFSNEDSSYDIPTGGAWIAGRYVFEVEKTDEGTYEMYFEGSGPSYIIVSHDGTVSEEYVKGLAGLVKEQDLAAYNGWWRANSEQFAGWSVDIEYASGEKILMEASGRAALECPFSLYAFLEYADLEAGYVSEYEQ